MDRKVFEDLIRKDREKKAYPDFSGTFLDYLELVKQDPGIVKLAHQRMYEIIMEQGAEAIRTEEHPRLKRIYGNQIIKKYKFFEDFYGIDETIMKIVRYFHSAAMMGEESRQVLYLVGPVGAGKSSFMEALKRGLEMSPPIFALKGCPMRE